LKKLLASWKDARERHRDRHRPTGFQFAAADSVQFLNGDHWDAVTESSSFFLQRSYLGLLEDFGPENLELKCSLIYKENKPLAAVVAQVINISGDRMLRAASTVSKEGTRNLWKKTFGPAARKASARIRDRVLVCGNLLSWGRHGVAFAPGMRSFEVKVNRKARRTALRGVLSNHASDGTLAILDGSGFEAPSTKQAAELLAGFGDRPTLVVVSEDEELLIKSFRNLEKVLVVAPSELEVASLVWARSVLISEAALPLVLGRAGVAAEEEEESE